MVRKQFTFYSSFWEAVKELPDEYALQSLKAIIGYALTGEEPEITGVAKAMFELARPTLDLSRKKAESGSVGGSTGTGASKDRTSDAEQRESESQANASKPQANRKQTASKKEKEYEIEYEYEGYPPYSPPLTVESTPKGFDEFWCAYPKKVGKKAAQKSFAKAIKTVDLQTLLAAIDRQKRGTQWSRDNGRYIPNPATWLNQGRWDDEEEKTITAPRTTGNIFADLVLGGELRDP